MASSSTHYALVNAGSDPLSIQPEDDSWDANRDPRHELTRLYQQYAELYPNPRLVEEYRLKNTLLQAASAAGNAQFASQRSSRGFFARLFSSTKEEKKTPDHHVPFDAPLVYTDIPNEQDDGSLCGTLQSLDRSCIPLEAYSVARFHLTSLRTRGEHPNAIRWGPLLGRATPTSLIVVGLGLLAELQPNKSSTIRATSDRTALLEYAQVHPDEFRLEYVRACGISPNCLAISWGFQDGLVAIYRRIQWHKDASKDAECGWELMWMVGPSPAVLDAIGDLFHDDESHPGSPLLRVADLLPLRVSTGDRRQPMVCTLTVARLGGYLELLPVPTDLWFGPLLTHENHRRPKTPKRKQGQHYATGKSIGGPTITLTTAQHQLDILSMDALRTTVGLETEWNNQAFPDAPPSEYIVAVSGLAAQSPGRECISFWSVCTLFSEGEKEAAPIGFELHSVLLETTTLESGAEVSVFATPEILERWRMPRQVALRPDAAIMIDADMETREEWNDRITTISTPAPIVSMQFLDQKGSAFLAILDWNGATTIFDCAPMERTASQSLSWEELARLELNHDENSPKPPMHRTIISRTQFTNIVGRRTLVGALQWLKPSTIDGHGNFFEHLCPIVLLLRNERKLLVVTFSFQDEHGQTIEPNGSVLALPFPGNGAIMGDLGTGNLLFVCKQQHNHGSSFLKCFVMHHLQPTAIVESLVREQKYEEAVVTAQKLDELDQATLAEVIEECHRRLWETKRDIDHLAETRNITYIVEQAIVVCESSEVDEELPLDKLRVVCNLATTMGRNNRPVKDLLNQIGAFLIRLGTYELLCKHFLVPLVASKFRKEFQETTILDVAKSIARRGDISALSIVLFRHRSELAYDLFDVLAEIPLSVHHENFIHLLPLVKDGDFTDTYLPTVFGDIAALHLSHMPQHIKDTDGVAIVIDTKDEKLVLEHNSRIGMNSNSVNLTSKASRWFVDRSIQMQHFTGNIEAVISFCDIGLRCNGCHVRMSEFPVQELQSLFKTWRSATSLQKILLDEYVSLAAGEESKESASMIICTDDLLSMELPELVDLILRGETDCAKIVSKFNDYLQPLLLELSGDDSKTVENEFDSALVSYSSGLAIECVALSKKVSHQGKVLELAKRTLGTCAAIATSSKSSTRKQDRLIKDITVLIQLILGVVSNVTLALEKIELDARNRTELFNALWTMYEALPNQVPSSMELNEHYLPLLQELDDFFVDLICADVLSRWPGSKPFSFLAKPRHEKECSFQEVGTSVVLKLCNAFMASIHGPKTREKTSTLLNDLLSDIEEVAKYCCQDSLHLPELLCTHLVRPLLHEERFHLVVDYCTAPPSLVDQERVQNAVLSYMDEAIFSENENSNRVMSAMKCQDIIGPAFPEIQPAFLSIRRFLDAAHFISTVIFEGRGMRSIRPAELRKQLPLDTLESIIKEVPQSILCGCSQWQDEVYAKSANEILRISTNVKHPDIEVPKEMPVLPGGAVFHLATILGLEDDNAAIVVKSRVIHHAVSVGLHGAAAAICRTMIWAEINEFSNQAIALAMLEAVAEIVSDENYEDLATKQELCHTSLMKHMGHVDCLRSRAFDAICAVSSNLDHRTSRHSRERHGMSLQRQEQLMRRPYSRLQKQIHSEYNADLHGLFADLIIQTSDGLVHDSLMNALSRFVIYWCVSDAKTLRQNLVMSEKGDARENLALGCSLILQIPSKLTASNCVHELQKIAADQAANVSTEDRFGCDDEICIPDPQIVARMVGRGYMENAARRAVIMTRNAGYNEALGWAVTHTLDPNFNAPIVIFRNPRRAFIDEDAIQLLQETLSSMHCCLADDDKKGSLLSFLSSLHQPSIPSSDSFTISLSRQKKPMPASTLHSVNVVNKGQSRTVVSKQMHRESSKPNSSHLTKGSVSMISRSAVSIRETELESKPAMIPLAPKKEDTLLPLEQGKQEPRKPPRPSKLFGSHSRPEQAATVGIARSNLQVSPRLSMNVSTFRVEPSAVPEPIVPSSQALPEEEAEKSVRLAVTNDSVVTTNISDRSNARSELLKRGQVALSKVRSRGETTERKRLIAEGRELLRKARITNVSGSPGSTNVNGSTAPSTKTIEATPTIEGSHPAHIESSSPLPVDHQLSNRHNGSTAPPTEAIEDNKSEGPGWDFDNFDDM